MKIMTKYNLKARETSELNSLALSAILHSSYIVTAHRLSSSTISMTSSALVHWFFTVRHRQMTTFYKTVTWAHIYFSLLQCTRFRCIAAAHTGHQVKIFAFCPAISSVVVKLSCVRWFISATLRRQISRSFKLNSKWQALFLDCSNPITFCSGTIHE
jgi:hypothetical protein